MAVKSDFDKEIDRMKSVAETIRRSLTILGNTFKNIPPKDRARLMNKIESDQRALRSFLTRARNTETINTGSKFSLQNLNETYNLLQSIWRKTEGAMEKFSSDSLKKSAAKTTSSSSAKDQLFSTATVKYEDLMKQLGYSLDLDQRKDFKQKLEVEYKNAVEKTGSPNLEISISLENGKIMVKIY